MFLSVVCASNLDGWRNNWSELGFDQWISFWLMHSFLIIELEISVDTSLNDVHSLHWLRLLWHWTPWWKNLSQDDYQDFYGEYDDYGDDGDGDYEYGGNNDDHMEWWWQYVSTGMVLS